MNFPRTTAIILLGAAVGAFCGAYRESWSYIKRGRDIPYRRVWMSGTRAALAVAACAIAAQLAVLFLRGSLP